MKNIKLKKVLLTLSVMSAPAIVAEVIDENIAAAEYKAGVYYSDGKAANGWVNDGTGTYYFQNGKKYTGYATDYTGKKFFLNGKYADGKIGNYTFKNGVLVTTTTVTPTPKKEASKTGWYQEAGKRYYGNADGTLAKNKWVGDYYLGSTGVMLVNTWTPDGYYVDATGKWVKGKKQVTTTPKVTVKTGWYQELGKWYYRNTDGTLAKNKWVGDYYLGSTGLMLVNTWTPDGYYVDATGKWVKGKKQVTTTPKATVKTGWYQEAGKWYYGNADGTLAKNKWVGDYYLGSTGVMLVNTWTPDGYYVDAKGKWVKDKKQTTNTTPSQGTSYVSGKLYKDGKLANGWVNDGSGDYYFQNGLKHTGYATDTTGKKFFINGKYADGKIGINGKYADGKIGSYTFKNGELVLPGSDASTTTPKKEVSKTGWYQEAGKWYYGNVDGTLAKNKWVGDYYLGSTGVMLVNTWTPDGYYVDATGKWVKDKIAKEKKVVYYTQDDKRWANKYYGSYKMWKSGCVPTSLSMIISTLGEKNVTAEEVADYLYYNTPHFNKKEIGTKSKGVEEVLNHYGLNYNRVTSMAQLQSELKAGKLVYAAVTAPFTAVGATHAIVLSGLDSSNKVTVYNPYSPYGIRKYNVSTVWNNRSDYHGDLIGGTPIIAVY